MMVVGFGFVSNNGLRCDARQTKDSIAHVELIDSKWISPSTCPCSHTPRSDAHHDGLLTPEKMLHTLFICIGSVSLLALVYTIVLDWRATSSIRPPCFLFLSPWLSLVHHVESIQLATQFSFLLPLPHPSIFYNSSRQGIK